MEFLSTFAIFLGLSYYSTTLLQWYNYKLKRVLLNHHKKRWHIYYFVAPLIASALLSNTLFMPLFALIYLVSLYLWKKSLDRPLVFTARVKNLFIFSVAVGALIVYFLPQNPILKIALVLSIAYFYNIASAKVQLLKYSKKAQSKLKFLREKEGLKVITITASYGKTSIKNFLYQILSTKFRAYKSPRSVNTYVGIMKDINVDMPQNIEIYISEAGARESGDIREIVELICPEIAILGQIGEQHIEYFKSIENIKKTKSEILESKNLQKAFIYKDNAIEHNFASYYPSKIKNIESSLQGVCFELEINGVFEQFKAPILGEFNINNIAVCIAVAKELQMSIEQIKKAVSSLKSVEHRLQKIEAGGKIIIDDSFNGNLEGILEGIKISGTHKGGKKIVITPGLVESTESANIKVAQEIDKVFDTAIITGELNSKIFDEHIKAAKKIILKDKSKIEEIIAKESASGDLILFANDAPNFI